MATTTTTTNKPLNPRAQDLSPKGYNRAALYSGKALDFDGVNDYVDGGTLDITAYTQMSVSFYMNVDTTTQDFRLISIRYIGADDIRIFHSISIGAGVLNFSLDDGDVDNIGVNFETNQWYHVVMTHDGTTLKAYFNGVEQASTASTFDYANANGLFYVGRYTGGAVTYYDGEASNVKIFNTALTAAQVADLYLNPEKIVPDGVADSALKLWLPMMEGAGTTAYDGSGNGNHGTIDGATWVSGIGAPVAQTALVSWNKGVNNLAYSEDFSQYATGGDAVLTSGFSAPDGSNNAYKISSAASNGSVFRSGESGANYYRSIWARTTSGTGTIDLLSYFENTNNTFTITEEWQRFEVSTTDSLVGVNNLYAVDFRNTSATLNEVIIWGGQTKADSSSGPYVPTYGTAQTSPVLLPQGLTANKDITGVNAFESARNPYALNLDGASWAEVHDNASLDIKRDYFGGWIYTNSIKCNRILSKWFSGYPNRTFQFSAKQHDDLYLYISDGSSSNNTFVLNVLSISNNWYHCVATYDGSKVKVYLDERIESNGGEHYDLNIATNPFILGLCWSLDSSGILTPSPTPASTTAR
jgi:heat shock protein HspQ